MKAHLFLVISLCTTFISCKKDTPFFSLIPSTETGVTFKNTITENEIINLYDFHNMYNGAGVAIGDINNDNLPDIFFTANMTDDKLYLNKGNLRFEDISEKAGILNRRNDGRCKCRWLTGYICL
jgi:enediyne biosynthesis protein E4